MVPSQDLAINFRKEATMLRSNQYPTHVRTNVCSNDAALAGLPTEKPFWAIQHDGTSGVIPR